MWKIRDYLQKTCDIRVLSNLEKFFIDKTVVEDPTPLVQPLENPLMPTIETMPSTITHGYIGLDTIKKLRNEPNKIIEKTY